MQRVCVMCVNMRVHICTCVLFVIWNCFFFSYSELLESTFSAVVFIQFIESAAGCCLGIFLLNLVDGVNFLKLVFFVVGHLVQLLFYCVIGNDLMYEVIYILFFKYFVFKLVYIYNTGLVLVREFMFWHSYSLLCLI